MNRTGKRIAEIYCVAVMIFAAVFAVVFHDTLAPMPIGRDCILILAIYHGARQWPEAF